MNELPTNCTFTLERETPGPIDDGTPTYTVQTLGPFSGWYREVAPEIENAASIDTWTANYAKLYVLPAVDISQADSMIVTVADSVPDPIPVLEVVTVRQRTGRAGVHHLEALVKRIIEAR